MSKVLETFSGAIVGLFLGLVVGIVLSFIWTSLIYCPLIWPRWHPEASCMEADLFMGAVLTIVVSLCGIIGLCLGSYRKYKKMRER